MKKNGEDLWIKNGQSITAIVIYLIKGMARMTYGRIKVHYLMFRINQKLKKLKNQRAMLQSKSRNDQ